MSSTQVKRLKIERVKLNALHEDPANPRTHPTRNAEAIKASLKEFGQAEPLVVQKSSNKVIGGNGRLKAMRELEWKDCDVVKLDVDDTKAAALGIALNRTAELADWNFDNLAGLMKTIGEDIDLTKLGWEDYEISALFRDLNQDVTEISSSIDENVDDITMIECPKCGHKWPS